MLNRYGRLGASSRVRSLQYVPYFESNGWQVVVSPLFPNNYLDNLYQGENRIPQVIAGYWNRIFALIKAKSYDLIWIEKEVFPFLPAFVERLLVTIDIPYIVDYDDALFHRYDRHQSLLVRLLLGRKIDKVMKHATLVIAGNEYLAEHAQVAGARLVEIVPSTIDLTRYSVNRKSTSLSFIVGWIGTPKTFRYLQYIIPVIEALRKDFDVQFLVVGVNENNVKKLPFKAQPWSEETEVKSIQEFDVGIMPLIDSPWEKGKCGYKLIQYMACSLPVVASSVGVNKQIIEHGENGYLAHDLIGWEQALRRLLNNQRLRLQMGDMGRKRVEAWYSLQVQAPRLEELMHGVLRRRSV